MEIDDLYDDAAPDTGKAVDAPIEGQPNDAAPLNAPITTDEPVVPAEETDGTPAVDTDIPDQTELTGVEQYLSQFDIEGGMISFDSGESKHFDTLSADKQSEILSNLHNQNETTIEDKFGLDETEIGLINHLRENKQSVEEMVEEMASRRVETILTKSQAGETDFTAMSEDAIYTAFLRSSNEKITDDQIEKDLTAAKSMSNYNNVVDKLRTDMVSTQERAQQHEVVNRRKELDSTIEDQRRLVVETVQGIDTLDGLGINDGIKNDVLDTILSVDDDGDSVFMTEVFSDPKSLFRAAFWYNNGPDILKSREDYWKKQKSEAFKRGQEYTAAGGQTFVKSKKTTPNQTAPGNPESFDDLYD